MSGLRPGMPSIESVNCDCASNGTAPLAGRVSNDGGTLKRMSWERSHTLRTATFFSLLSLKRLMVPGCVASRGCVSSSWACVVRGFEKHGLPAWSYWQVLSSHQAPSGSLPTFFDRLVVDSAAATALAFLVAAAVAAALMAAAAAALEGTVMRAPPVPEPPAGAAPIAAIIIAICSFEIDVCLDE